jgi:hypothetical protein
MHTLRYNTASMLQYSDQWWIISDNAVRAIWTARSLTLVNLYLSMCRKKSFNIFIFRRRGDGGCLNNVCVTFVMKVFYKVRHKNVAIFRQLLWRTDLNVGNKRLSVGSKTPYNVCHFICTKSHPDLHYIPVTVIGRWTELRSRRVSVALISTLTRPFVP